jgi:UDP-N-acetylglucosamine 2-epimerase
VVYPRIIGVCGVRPQYVKWASLERALRAGGGDVKWIDARQQYDPGLTRLIVSDLGLAATWKLEHDSREKYTRGGAVYAGVARILEREKHDSDAVGPIVVVLGDVRATVMAAVAAAELGLPIVHFEAGVRSDSHAAESIENRLRRMMAGMAALNLCVLPSHVANLETEHVPGRVELVGDLTRPLLRSIASKTPATDFDYVLVHVHKDENASRKSWGAIRAGIAATKLPTVVISHPRYRREIDRAEEYRSAKVTVVPPQTYREMVGLMTNARVIVTDSGSVQREAFHLGKRCVVRRSSVGWKELLHPGGHVVAEPNARALSEAIRTVWAEPVFQPTELSGFYVEDGEKRALNAILRIVDRA